MNSLVINTLDIDRDLLNSIAAEAEVIVLDSTENIQERITEILKNYSDLSSVHFVLPERDEDRASTGLDIDKGLEIDSYPLSSFFQEQSLLELRQSFVEDAAILFHEYNPGTKTFKTLKELAIVDLLEALETGNISLKSDEPNNDAKVTTDLDDYPPGSTAVITGSNFQPGETIELQVLHTDGVPNTGGGHDPWQVTDGGAGDLDGRVDGNFQTTWYVNPDDSANSAFEVTATGLSSGKVATNTFTDSVIFSDNFDGAATGWTVNPNNTDNATTDANGQWTIDAPVAHNRFGDTRNEQLTPYSGTKTLLTGKGGNPSDVTRTSGTATDAVTTVRSPNFTLSNSPNFNTLAFRYYLSTNDHSSVTGIDSFKVELVKASDNTILSTLLNAVHAHKTSSSLTRTGEWSLASTSLDSYSGENVYLRLTATDADNNSILEVGVDNVSVTSVDKSGLYTTNEKYSLGNRIWNDANNNGQLNPGESGINGVIVNLYKDSNNDGTPDGAAIATDTTSNGGYYRFDNLLADNYIVEVAASNFNTGNPLAGLISSSVDEADPDSNVDKNDNGIGTAPSPTNGIRSGTVTLGSSYIEPTGETDLEPVPFTTLNVTKTQSVGTSPNLYLNAIDGANRDRYVGSGNFFNAFNVDVTGYGTNFTGFCIEFAEFVTPGAYTPVNATGPAPYYNTSYQDPNDISNFFGVDPNSANYGIITQAELDLISTVWFNKNSTLKTNVDDAAAMQALIWELQNDQIFDLSSGNFYLDPDAGTNNTNRNKTREIKTTVETWVNNFNTGTWTGSLPLAILTYEDQQDIVVNLDLGVGSTDSQSNLTLDFGFTDQIDYGDAPDTSAGNSTGDYTTTSANGGASHGIVTGLTIGSTIDKDNGTLQNTAATADDITNNGATDDEDGISSFSTLKTDDGSYSVTVSVTNTVGAANLVGWIDFNQDGWFQASEAATTSVANLPGVQSKTLTWNSIPNDIKAGTTYARFRLSTDSALTTSYSTGAAINGEVEDYQIAIYNSIQGNPYSEEISGTAGNDFIIGGKGQDTLTGNGGDDLFYFNETSESVDIITDFNDGDRIVLTQILDNELSSYTGNDPIGDGYVVIDDQGSVGTTIQIDFDAGNESTPTDLFHKDLVFLQGVAAASIDSSDFIF